LQRFDFALTEVGRVERVADEGETFVDRRRTAVEDDVRLARVELRVPSEDRSAFGGKDEASGNPGATSMAVPPYQTMPVGAV
jgi:hypothetical protein